MNPIRLQCDEADMSALFNGPVCNLPHRFSSTYSSDSSSASCETRVKSKITPSSAASLTVAEANDSADSAR